MNTAELESTRRALGVAFQRIAEEYAYMGGRNPKPETLFLLAREMKDVPLSSPWLDRLTTLRQVWRQRTGEDADLAQLIWNPYSFGLNSRVQPKDPGKCCEPEAWLRNLVLLGLEQEPDYLETLFDVDDSCKCSLGQALEWYLARLKA